MQIFRAGSGRSACLRNKSGGRIEGHFFCKERLLGACPECQRSSGSRWCLDCYPTHHVTDFRIADFARQKLAKILPLRIAGKFEYQTGTASAWLKRKHQTGRLGCRTKSLDPQRESTMPSIGERIFCCLHLKFGVPHQGSIGEYPDLLVASPLLDSTDKFVQMPGRDGRPIRFRAFLFDHPQRFGNEF